MATLGMRHAVLWVSDPQVSAAFYEEALGLEIKERTGLKVPLIMRFEDNYPAPIQDKVIANMKRWGFE